MSITLTKISDNVAREVTMYLLRQGCFTQTEIAELVGRSQSWVSWIKQDMDMIASNTLSCPNNTPRFQFIKAPNSAISR